MVEENQCSLCAKLRGDQSNRCRDIAMFSFSRWRPNVILDCFKFEIFNSSRVQRVTYFAITAAESHTKTKIQQTNIHNTSSNAKKRKKEKKKAHN